MHIWVGIDVEEQLAEIRKVSFEADREIGFLHSCFTLPLHISLKMSFLVEDAIAEDVMGDLEAYYRSLLPFDIPVRGIENEGGIVWIRMGECDSLCRIHDDLNRLLSERYGVGLHAYDCDYKFHTTLFMDDCTEKINAAYERAAAVPLPSRLCAKRFVIGCSPSGELGTYRVVRRVDLEN